MASSKKGQVFADVAYFGLFLFAGAIIMGVIFNVIGYINTDIQAAADMPTVSKTIYSDINSQYPVWWDNAFIFLLFGLWAGLLITSFLIDTHPVFFIFAFIGLIFVFIAIMTFSNAYSAVATDAGFIDSFPKVAWVMDHFLAVVVIISFTCLIALFAKSQV